MIDKCMLWGVEHSNIQNCFHVDRLDKILEMNLTNYLTKGEGDYQLLFLGTFDECNKFVCDMYDREK